MMTRIKGYVDLLRPFTLLAPLIVSSCIMITSLIYNGKTNIPTLNVLLTIIPASVSLAILNGASNALNQATDFNEDKISKPYRPIPRGIIQPDEAKKTAYILYLSAFLLSITINMMFSLFITLIAFFTITYSLPPRIKKVLFLNQLWVAIPRGLLGIMASWSVFGDPLQKMPLAIGCIAAVFLFGGTSTKDILDAEADKRSDVKTLVNIFGVKKTALISFSFMTAAFILIIPLIILGVLEIYLYPLVSLTILTICIFWLMTHNNKSQKKYVVRGENTSAWTLMYTTYFIYALGFAFITIYSV
ncbi:MAG: 4-hydroxybenzoate polyprenyltransferase [Thermoplasmata archaeon]|nr:MAG: 4-hydroxybenzoate polyprenyltransferase [Thermoplasmata archaeon]RLF35957.1 MAG: 4-hydroxybenzoate polyprenyltransferase [Thermoplasmata archaeon]